MNYGLQSYSDVFKNCNLNELKNSFTYIELSA